MRGDLVAFWPNVVSLVYGWSTLLSLVSQSATTYLKIKIRASGKAWDNEKAEHIRSM
jgi:hypothetical protein